VAASNLIDSDFLAHITAAANNATLWTTAACRGARIDVAQALAFAGAHGLDVNGD
jgi:hypothetical protein